MSWDNCTLDECDRDVTIMVSMQTTDDDSEAQIEARGFCTLHAPHAAMLIMAKLQDCLIPKDEIEGSGLGEWEDEEE